MLHAQRDWCRTHDLPHVLVVPGAADSVERDGTLTTHTIASPLVPGSPTYRLLLRSDKVLRILRDEAPDIIETHCAYNLPWTALLHRRRHGGIVSGVYMTDLPTAYVEAPLAARVGARAARVARRATEAYLRSLYARCDVVIAISPAMLRRLVELGVHGAHLVPLGVDLETFSPARRDAALRQELGVGSDGLLLIYAGRLDREKRPDLVLEAFARLRETRADAALVVVGEGTLRAQLESRAAVVGRARVIPFVQSRHEMARLLASADVYVSAMAHETFGLSVVEAQACALPVVGVRAGAMTDRVRDGIDGFLVEPGSADALAAPLVRTPRDAWREMGARARTRVASELSWRRTFETLYGIYRTNMHQE